MGGVAALAVGTLVLWFVLMLVLPVAQRLADFSLPGLVETAWKVAVIALLANVVFHVIPIDEWFAGLGVLGWGLNMFLSALVYWALMSRWFDMDFFGAIVIVVVSFFMEIWLVALILAICCT